MYGFLVRFLTEIRFAVYDESNQDLWDDLVEEYEGRIQGGGCACFTANRANLSAFISDLKILNALICSLAPDASLIVSGPLVSEDREAPYAAIYFDVDDRGEIVLKVLKLPEEETAGNENTIQKEVF